MTDISRAESEVKQTVENLINIATSYDIDSLANIYHDQLKVTMVDHLGNVNFASKDDFIQVFKAKKAVGDPPMNTWAEWHHIEADGDKGLVVLSRKNNLNGADMKLFLSLDLVYETERWQVIREVIYLQPDV
jgi:ketosteroid isomerase-like protein